MKPIGLERRIIQTRAEVSPSENLIFGYAVVFDSLSEEMGGFREVIKPGSFTQTLADKSVRRHAFWNHESRLVLGSQENGSLVLRQDSKGIYFECRPQPTSYANDLMMLLRSGDVRKCSFGFMCAPGGSDWSESDDGQVLRTITNAKLYEVSVVTEPAYVATEADCRTARDEFVRFQRSRTSSMDFRRRALALRHR